MDSSVHFILLHPGIPSNSTQQCSTSGSLMSFECPIKRKIKLMTNIQEAPFDKRIRKSKKIISQMSLKNEMQKFLTWKLSM